MSSTDYQVKLFKRIRDAESWFSKHHASANGVWMQLARKDSGHTSITYAEGLDVALCYGWIDGQKKSRDDGYWLQKFTPRRARSMWSKVNRDKVARLIEEGRMQPAGQAEIDRARADGRWNAAYDGPRTASVPEDLQAMLNKNRKAKAFFATLDSRNRYAVLFKIQTAKRADTRTRRIREFVDMMARHEKPYAK